MKNGSSETGEYVSILLTPTKCYPASKSTMVTSDLTRSPFKSPTKSPSKRGILPLASQTIHTPKGRTGIPLPRKRSVIDLDKSARKRAHKTISSRILDEDSDDDELSQQDLRIADTIIKKSRGEETNPYGSDVEFEEDLTVVPKLQPVDDLDNELLSDDSDADDDLVNLNDDDDDDDGEVSDEQADLNNDVKIELKKLANSRNRSNRRSQKTSSETKPKLYGRLSKAKRMLNSLNNIFEESEHTVDSANDQKLELVETNLSKMSDFERNVYKKTNESIRLPMISGIPESKEISTKPDTSEFIPFPIPKVDTSGNIIDQEFLDKYFHGQKLDMNQTGRLADSRAVYMEGADGYFEQHSIRAKINHNSLAQNAPSLEYDDFNRFVDYSESILNLQKNKLLQLHKFLYNQWCFELSQGYNLNFFGIGSKVKILLDFVENYFIDWYHQVYDEEVNIMVINGFNPNLKFKNIFIDIVETFLSKEKKKEEKIYIPSLANEAGPFLKSFIENWRSKIKFKQLVLLIHNIDGDAMRDDKVQNILTHLATIPEIWIISSVDNINAPLIWDLFRMKSFNFLWHDLTTYSNYLIELKFKDVLAIGRSKKFVGDKGAKFVLSSLTMNARKLYKILLDFQISNLKKLVSNKSSRNNLKGNLKSGIEFKTLYNACLENFITSNEINFRTVLREFVEHKMCSLMNDESGTEKVFIPFTIDEMEKLSTEEFQNTLE